MTVTICFLCCNNNGSGGFRSRYSLPGGGCPSLHPDYSSFTSHYNIRNKITKHTSITLEDMVSSPLARLYTNVNGCGWRSFKSTLFAWLRRRRRRKKNFSLSFHFPHKSGIPLPVKVGRLSVESGVPGDRKRETEVPLGKPFNATIYTAARAGS